MSEDLIKRSDAIRIMACEMYAEAQSQGYDVDSIEDFIPEAKAWMKDAPSTDRPQGKWIDDVEAESNGYYWANCSQCGLQIDVHENRGYYNYCPNCGARMLVKSGGNHK